MENSWNFVFEFLWEPCNCESKPGLTFSVWVQIGHQIRPGLDTDGISGRNWFSL